MFIMHKRDGWVNRLRKKLLLLRWMGWLRHPSPARH